MTLHRLSVAAILALILTSTALACGDSLYRAGKGTAYRTYSAPLPGNLLVFGTSEGARQLAEELARSGHNVRYVNDAREMASELERDRYDVVIAPFSERQSVESIATSSSFLPIAIGGDETKRAKQSYDRVMVSDKHELKHYLKAIHRALKDNG